MMMEDAGKFDVRYLAFLETISQLRPQLHRYCSRMTGSITDGEDVVQEALFRAYRSLNTYDDSRPVAPWLFRIAHNQCIDFLRRRGVQAEADTAAAELDFVAPHELSGARVGPAIEHLVLNLPSKSGRACSSRMSSIIRWRKSRSSSTRRSAASKRPSTEADRNWRH